jgi:hypothetical protein
MADDSNDEADLLAALESFCVTDAGSSSDSDDDSVAMVDTSAVSQLLAGRRSCDAADFGALAEALKSVIVTSSGVSDPETAHSEIQVCSRAACDDCRSPHNRESALIPRSRFGQQMRAARVAALEASLSDCKLLVSSVAESTDRSNAERPAIAADAALSTAELQRIQVCRRDYVMSQFVDVSRCKSANLICAATVLPRLKRVNSRA